LLDRDVGLGVDHRVGDDGTERDVLQRDHARGLAQALVVLTRGRPALEQHEDAYEGQDSEEDPDEQDQAIRALQGGWSPRADVTAGTTLTSGLRRATRRMT